MFAECCLSHLMNPGSCGFPEKGTGLHLPVGFHLGAVNKGAGNVDPSVQAVFQDYVKLMPLIAEVNQMSEELEKVRKQHHSRSTMNLREQIQLSYHFTNISTNLKQIHGLER